jgi:hypothetical protein
MSRSHVTFFCAIVASVTFSLFLLIGWMPPLLIVIGNAVLFTILSFVMGRFYWPSGLLALCLIGFLIYAALFPWIQAAQSHTPEEHLGVARSHAASWRFPVGSEKAALPHYKIAAEAGIPDAELAVGMAYLYRHYGEVFDRDKARFWLERAAAGGDISAQRQLPFVATVPEIK